jgi:hypothetical protein
MIEIGAASARRGAPAVSSLLEVKELVGDQPSRNGQRPACGGREAATQRIGMKQDGSSELRPKATLAKTGQLVAGLPSAQHDRGHLGI